MTRWFEGDCDGSSWFFFFFYSVTLTLPPEWSEGAVTNEKTSSSHCVGETRWLSRQADLICHPTAPVWAARGSHHQGSPLEETGWSEKARTRTHTRMHAQACTRTDTCAQPGRHTRTQTRRHMDTHSWVALANPFQLNIEWRAEGDILIFIQVYVL